LGDSNVSQDNFFQKAVKLSPKLKVLFYNISFLK